MYEVGDRVFLKLDPKQALGTIKEKIYSRYFVVWDNGRTWIYPASWLEKKEEQSKV